MDQLLDILRLDTDRTEVLGAWEILLALFVSLLCALVVARVYRHTHRTSSYSQSFVQTLVLVSLVTTLIMIVIGSNIARAFSLVGALSVIRFRNAIKETRDVAFVFFALAIAMAAGTRFYGVAVIATLFISCVLLAFHYLDFGAGAPRPERLLRVQLGPGRSVEDSLGDTLRSLFDSYAQLRVESIQKGMYNRFTLTVRPKADTTSAQVIEKLRDANDGLEVSYDVGQHTDDL